jgi:hypothetical protein
MAIYPPEPFLTSFDKELLRLLSELVLQEEQGWVANRHKGLAELSDTEARLLVELLEEFIASKRTQEASYLIERIFSGDTGDLKRAREIYLRGRVERGRTRAVASVQWNEFLMRLGIYPSTQVDRIYWHRASARPMSSEYFLQMESRLLAATGVHPRIRSLILDYVQLNMSGLTRVLSGEEKLAKGQVLMKPKKIKDELKFSLNHPVGQRPQSVKKIIGTMTIVMDMSVLYTTRDWSVAGTMSTIAGALPLVALD